MSSCPTKEWSVLFFIFNDSFLRISNVSYVPVIYWSLLTHPQNTFGLQIVCITSYHSSVLADSGAMCFGGKVFEIETETLRFVEKGSFQ